MKSSVASKVMFQIEPHGAPQIMILFWGADVLWPLSSFATVTLARRGQVICTVVCIIVRRFAFLWSKMPMFQRAGMREGGLPLPPAFQYLNLMTWRAYDLNLVIRYLPWPQNAKTLNRGLQFHFIKQLKNKHPKFKALKLMKITGPNLNCKLFMS